MIPPEELLQGAVDLHAHASPDLYQRLLSDEEVALRAHDAGLKAVIIKTHNFPTITRVRVIDQRLHGIAIFGSVVLNHHVGGLNPVAVEAALQFGARKVFMPTVDALHHRKITGQAGQHGKGLTLEKGISDYYRSLPALSAIDEEGKLVPEVQEILRLVKEHDALLSLGHLSFQEDMVILREARNIGLRRVIVDHPFFSTFGLDQQGELVEAGAYLNYVYGAELSPRWAAATVEEMVEGIRRFGPRVVMSSDCGQLHNPPHVEALRIFIRLLMEDGIGEDQIRQMVVETPSDLLSI